MYAHHGHDWQRAQQGYNKVQQSDFGKKCKLMWASKGVQQLELASPGTAVSIMKSKVQASASPLVRFIQKLPSLASEIHPDGKQAIVAGPTAQGLSSDQKDLLRSVPAVPQGAEREA